MSRPNPAGAPRFCRRADRGRRAGSRSRHGSTTDYRAMTLALRNADGGHQVMGSGRSCKDQARQRDMDPIRSDFVFARVKGRKAWLLLPATTCWRNADRLCNSPPTNSPVIRGSGILRHQHSERTASVRKQAVRSATIQDSSNREESTECRGKEKKYLMENWASCSSLDTRHGTRPMCTSTRRRRFAGNRG